MNDNSWYENGELPPAGAKVIVNSIYCKDDYPRSFHGMKVDIHFHMIDHQGDEIAIFSMVDPEDRDCLKFHGMMKNCFRPIKTERELAISDMINVVSNGRTWQMTQVEAGMLYDAGYHKK